jgi:hypothetical protein
MDELTGGNAAATAAGTVDSGRMPPDDRKAALDRTLQKAGAVGWRIETRSDFQATIATGDRPNHLLHLVLTILTGGLWGLFVWAPVVAFGGLKRRMITIDEYGDVIDNKV